jgi:hypothetical protein
VPHSPVSNSDQLQQLPQRLLHYSEASSCLPLYVPGLGRAKSILLGRRRLGIACKIHHLPIFSENGGDFDRLVSIFCCDQETRHAIRIECRPARGKPKADELRRVRQIRQIRIGPRMRRTYRPGVEGAPGAEFRGVDGAAPGEAGGAPGRMIGN